MPTAIKISDDLFEKASIKSKVFKRSFLLKLKPSLRTIEGHVLSIADKTDTDTRSGKWIWELKK